MKIAREMGGIRAGAIVLIGVVITNVGNYAFHFLAAQALGPTTYGGVVSLLTLATLVGLPLAGVQLGVARYVSSYAALGNHDAIRAIFFRGTLLATAVSSALALLLLGASPLIERLLDVDSRAGIVLTALIIVPAVVTPVAWGVAQGLQRFGLLALSMVLGTSARLVLLAAFVLSGSRLVGAILATLLGSLVSLAVALWPLRQLTDRRAKAPLTLRRATRELMPVVGGLLAITSLTSLDVIVAKSVLVGNEAGIYGGASLIGRVILYVPAAIATVLLPKVSSRVETRRETTDIVGASMAVTLALCAATTAVYAAAPNLVITSVLGEDYADGGPLLWLFGVAMSEYAVLNLLLVYHLGHGLARMTWLLLAGALVQLAGYLAFHDSPYQLIGVSITTAALLIVAHELMIASGSRMTAVWVAEAARVLRRNGRPR